MEPKRKILSLSDLEKFKKSEDFADYVEFIQNMSNSVIGKKISDSCEESGFVTEILHLLDRIEGIIDDAPPLKHDSRFGNPQFRLFYDLVGKKLSEGWFDFIPEQNRLELFTYVSHSFGDRQRIGNF